jgi:hypothetical protein
MGLMMVTSNCEIVYIEPKKQGIKTTIIITKKKERRREVET